MKKRQSKPQLLRFFKRGLLISIPALLVMAILVAAEELPLDTAVRAVAFIVVLNHVFIMPFMFRLQDVAEYVTELAKTGRVRDVRRFTRSKTNESARIVKAVNAIAKFWHDKLRSLQGQKTQMEHDFIANASHELKTPLAVLKGSLETLRYDPEAAAKFIPLMMAQVDRMQKLIQNLLDLSYLETDRPLQEFGAVSIAKQLIHVSRASPKCQLGKLDRQAFVYGLEDELLQVFSNLADNAVKYGTQGQPVRISMSVDNGLVTVDINNKCDQPIPEDLLPRLTERFFRVDKKQAGYGLGLAIVQAIVAKHDGSLKVESNASDGTTFSIILPVYEED
ncbi:MAG: HAMP domain-containing histidine kinase [Alphaproteobacteria bacterium]|nr:HAMP domain-containing histidine kinase [Alphaproteobacteria bacterium]